MSGRPNLSHRRSGFGLESAASGIGPTSTRRGASGLLSGLVTTTGAGGGHPGEILRINAFMRVLRSPWAVSFAVSDVFDLSTTSSSLRKSAPPSEVIGVKVGEIRVNRPKIAEGGGESLGKILRDSAFEGGLPAAVVVDEETHHVEGS